MNRKDKKAINEFKNKYQKSDCGDLPNELSKEKITELLYQKSFPDFKAKIKISPLKKIVVATVVIAMISGIGIAAMTLLRQSIPAVAWETPTSESTKSDEMDVAKSPTDYSKIREIFKKIDVNNPYVTFYSSQSGDSAAKPAGNKDSKDDAKTGQTNIQVEGVDESDIVKNDGKYLYRVYSKGVHIASLLPADKMEIVCTVKVADNDQTYIKEIYIRQNKLIVLGEIYNNIGKAKSFASVYDMADKSDVKLLKQFIQDGRYISSRLIENQFYILTDFTVDIQTEKGKEDCIPSAGYSEELKLVAANDIYIVDKPQSPNYLVVSSINVDNLKDSICTKAVLGSGDMAYCNTQNLFVAVQKVSYKTTVKKPEDSTEKIFGAADYNCSTEIYKFDLQEGKVGFNCKNTIDGYIDSQFSMDEYKGNFRVATTGYDDEGKLTNSVFVLDNKMKEIGKVTGIALGEQIYSVRFLGDKAYVVTFKNTDPLFVLDLSIPESPKILGELKITGFSEYLHPISENLLLGIGKNGNENGVTPGIKLALFDVSNPTNPVEVSTYIVDSKLEKYYIQTGAWQSHKSVMFYDEENIFGIPVSVYDYTTEYYGQSINAFHTFKIEDKKIIAYKVFEGPKFSGKDDYYHYSYYSNELRGTYVGGILYIVSDVDINAYTLADGKKVGSLKF